MTKLRELITPKSQKVEDDEKKDTTDVNLLSTDFENNDENRKNQDEEEKHDP